MTNAVEKILRRTRDGANGSHESSAKSWGVSSVPIASLRRWFYENGKRAGCSVANRCREAESKTATEAPVRDPSAHGSFPWRRPTALLPNPRRGSHHRAVYEGGPLIAQSPQWGHASRGMNASQRPPLPIGAAADEQAGRTSGGALSFAIDPPTTGTNSRAPCALGARITCIAP
jgi:hypothetical protein